MFFPNPNERAVFVPDRNERGEGAPSFRFGFDDRNERAIKRRRIMAEDCESDHEPEKPEIYNLSWRMNEEESKSDWCIRISFVEEASGENKVNEYHVHQSILSAGARKSDYFCSLFNNNYAEQQAQTSNIELPELAAKAFPAMLDYMYAADDTLEISTENAAALYHLAQYFGVQRLRWKAKNFWAEDLDHVTCGTYVEHAKALNEEKLLKAAVDTCVDDIVRVETTSRLVHVGDLDLWHDLLTRVPKDVEKSKHMSLLVAALVENFEVDAAGLELIAADDVLPNIHFNAAIGLLDAERKTLEASYSALTSLQKRCIGALVEGWSRIDLSNVNRIRLLHPSILGEIVVQSMKKAQDHVPFLFGAAP